MPVTFQEINESLASNVQPQNELKTERNKADKYLKTGEGNKPEWFDEFLTSNKNKLTETILRAISSQDGISSLSGYNEGYFNEIIQNANDLHAGECIDITVNKDGTTYSVKCSYQDKGFTLSNIYGFLNREMSDKSSDEGQTGKFGVGIKSFFKFVRKLRIESNIIIDIIIDREKSAVDSQISVNDRWDKKNTILSFEYDEVESKDSGFNITKLSKLVTLLDEEANDIDDKVIRRFFMKGEDQEIVFDIRSMIFMNKDPNKASITKLNFAGRFHAITVECHDFCEVQKIELHEEKWNVRNVGLDISMDLLEHDCYDYEYVILNHGKITIGIPLYVKTEKPDNNRFYSTYYIKTDTAPEFLPTGMIIDSHFANIHRNDLGDNERSIEEAYQKIRDFMLKAFQCMCSKEIASIEYLEDISYAFHHLLHLYLDADNTVYEESPFTISGLDNQYLPKISGDTKTDIVVHKSEENYQKSSYLDQDSVSALTDLYFDYIERENVIDFRELIESDECIGAVSQIYQKISSSGNSGNYQTAREILHYFPGVADYITYKISGEIREKAGIYDHEIDIWINNLRKEMGEKFKLDLCLKLIGRYNLNAAIAYNGSLLKENLSFKDYLFNAIPELENGVFSNWQNEQYDSMYSGLKQQLLNNRLYDAGNTQNKYLIRFIEPCSYSRRNWNGKFDCYGVLYYTDSFVSDTNKFLFLKKIASNNNLLSSISDNFLYLFERIVIDWKYRENRPYNGKPFEYCYPDYKQQIIRLGFLKNIVLDDFGQFLEAIQYRKIIKAFRSF